MPLKVFIVGIDDGVERVVDPFGSVIDVSRPALSWAYVVTFPSASVRDATLPAALQAIVKTAAASGPAPSGSGSVVVVSRPRLS